MHNLPDHWMNGDSTAVLFQKSHTILVNKNIFVCIQLQIFHISKFENSLVFLFANTEISILDKYIENVKYN